MRAAPFLVMMAAFLWGCTREPDPPVALTSTQGHDITFYRLPDARDVAISLMWQSDWAHRPDASPAVPAIGTRMMLSGGTGEMGAGEVQETFADIGAEGDLWPTPEGVRGILVAPQAHITRATQLANAILTAPALDLDWLERIADDIATEAAARHQDPSAAAFGVLRQAVLETQPLGRFLDMGEPQDIRAVTLDDIQSWRQDALDTARLTAVVSGPITEDEAKDLIDILLDGLPAGISPTGTHSLEAVNMAPRRILLHRPSAEAAMILTAGSLPPLSAQSEFDELIASVLLGGNEHSVLFEAVRVELRAAYEFGAVIDAFDQDHRIIVMQGEVEDERLAEVLDAVLGRYDDFRTRGLTGNIDDIVDEISGNLVEMMNDPVMAAETLLEIHLGDFPLDRFRQLPEEVATRSMETVRANTRMSFPPASEFMIVAVSSDVDALPGACVIREISEVETCSSR